MARAIELYFDADLEAAVRSMWQRLAEAGLPKLPSFKHGCHRPHFSLSVAERLDPSPVRQSIAAVVPTASVRVVLEHVALFAGGVLFLGAVPTAPILEMHAGLDSLLRGQGVEPWPHYVPG